MFLLHQPGQPGESGSFQVVVEGTDPKDAINRCRQRIRLVRKARSVFTSPVTIYFDGLIKLSGPMRRGVLVNYESRRTPPPPDARILCLVPTQPDQAVEGYGPKETEAADDSQPGRTDVFLDFGGIDRQHVLARERETQATARPTRPHPTSARPAPKPAGPARAERLAAEEVGRRRRDVLAATLDELRGSSK